MSRRLIAMLFVLLAGQAVVIWINRGYAVDEIKVPARSLASFPTSVGPWTGKDATLDERLVRAIGAHDVMSRIYQNPSGRTISLHLAAIGRYVDSIGHYPEVCYPGSGWEILGRQAHRIGQDKFKTTTARQLTVEKDGERARVLFWYRMGEQTFVDRESFKSARRAFFGQKQWPAVVKVLIHVPEDGSDEAESELDQFAAEVDKWVREIDKDGK